MRDPERLDETYAELERLHKKYCPDWRTGQLLFNFLSWLKEDPFYYEELQFKDLVHRFYAENFRDFNEQRQADLVVSRGLFAIFKIFCYNLYIK